MDQLNKNPSISKPMFVVRVIEAGNTVHGDLIVQVLNGLDNDGYNIISMIPNTFSTRKDGLQATTTDIIITAKLKNSHLPSPK